MDSFAQKSQSSRQPIVKAIAALCVGSAAFFASPFDVYGQTNLSTTGDAGVSVTDGTSTGLTGFPSSPIVADDDNIAFTGNHTLTFSGDNSGTVGSEVKYIGDITTTTDGQGAVVFNVSPSPSPPSTYSSLYVKSIVGVDSITVQSSGDNYVAVEIANANRLNIESGQAFGALDGYVNMLEGDGNLFSPTEGGGHIRIGDTASSGFNGSINTANLTLAQGKYNGSLTVHSLTKTGTGTVTLSGLNSFYPNYAGDDPQGDPIFIDPVASIEGGTLHLLNEDALGDSGSFGAANVNIGSAGTLMIGSDESSSSIDVTIAGLTAEAGSNIVLNIDSYGKASTLYVGNFDTSNGTANVSLGEANRDLFVENYLAPSSSGERFVEVIKHSASGAASTLQKSPNAVALQDLVTSRYTYSPTYVGNIDPIDSSTSSLYEAWGYSSTPSGMTNPIPDPSSFVMASIIAFDLPLSRAQYVNGPWAIFKGGEFSNDRSAFSDNTFQTLQVGWDKTLGKWNAGAFVEFDWLYGSGVHQLAGANVGNLRSIHKGTGGALYLSRDFRNNGYLDIVGRVTRFDNEAYLADADLANGDSGYNANWKNNIFSLGIEIGKNLTSQDGRWSFNPYNRLLYNSGSADEFGVNFAEGTDIRYRNHGYGTWTNRLGGRLSYRQLAGAGLDCNPCDPCEPCAPCDPCNPCDPCGNGGGQGGVKRIYFVSADYYQGLSGRYGASFSDPDLGAGFITNNGLGQVKNNMAYGVTSYGVTLFPRDNMTVSFIGSNIFGDVDGYSLTVGSTLSF